MNSGTFLVIFENFLSAFVRPKGVDEGVFVIGRKKEENFNAYNKPVDP